MNLKQLRIENDYIYNAISLDVAQCLFNKCTAKQMSFESGFKCGFCFSTSDLFWKLITTAVGKYLKVLCEPVVFLTDSILLIWVDC